MSSTLRTLRWRNAVPVVVVLSVVTASVALAGCSRSDGSARKPLGATASATSAVSAAQPGADGASTTDGGPKLSAAAAGALDEGNIAYRAKQYDAALAKYREAAAASPTHAAPWFGLYMAANEMKNSALADSAMQRVRALSADPKTLDAHAEISSAKSAPSGSLPSGHPATQLATPELPVGHPTAKAPLTPALPPGHPVPGATPAPPKAAGAAKRM